MFKPAKERKISDTSSKSEVSLIERAIEYAIFKSRWLLAPFHLAILLMLVALLIKCFQTSLASLLRVLDLSVKEMIVSSLTVIELALIANFLLVVVFSSYEGFVSRLDQHQASRDNLHWSKQLGFSALKNRLMGSVTAICGVYLLEKIMDGSNPNGADVMWTAVAFALFGVASILMEYFSRNDY